MKDIHAMIFEITHSPLDQALRFIGRKGALTNVVSHTPTLLTKLKNPLIAKVDPGDSLLI